MPFNNRKLHSVRLYDKEVNLSQIGPSWQNSYRYTAHTMHCQLGRKPQKLPLPLGIAPLPGGGPSHGDKQRAQKLVKIARVDRDISSRTD